MRAHRLGLSLVVPFVLVLGCAQKQPSTGLIPPSAPSASAPRVVQPRATAPGFDSAQQERIARVQPLVTKAATEHGLDPDLINGVIWVESRFQTKAKSPAGARGLMQLMPATAAALAREMETRRRMYDPEFNINAGTLYLAKLHARYEGNETLALAAYNAGAGNVNKWVAGGGLPEQSVSYVQAVVDARARFKALRRGPEPPTTTMLAAADKARTEPEPAAPITAEPVIARTPPEPTPPEPREEPVYEPPLAETPYVPENDADDDGPEVEDEPEVEDDEPEDVPPEVGPGVLPSVLD